MNEELPPDSLNAFYANRKKAEELQPDPVIPVFAEPPEAGSIEEESEPPPVAARNREGLLSLPARAALQRLLSRGVVLSRTHATDFSLLVNARDVIDPIMDSMGLSMSIHFDYGMAVVMRNEDLAGGVEGEGGEDDDADDENSSMLVRTSRLNLLQSLVLMVLRMYYREREGAGDRHVIIDLENLKDRLRPYWPLLNAESRSDRRFNGAIRKMQDHGILLNVRGKEDRREVSPVIIIALDSEKLGVMVSEYQRLAAASSKEEGSKHE